MAASKCVICGSQMKRSRENHRYECGPPNVTLVGAEVLRCPNCGEEEVVVHAVEDLHRALAHTLATKVPRLSAAEIRFLRTWLGLAGVDFAGEIGVTPETVSRWERGDKPQPMGRTAERLLRMLVLSREPVKDYPQLKERAVTEPETGPLLLKHARGGWRRDRAA